MILWYEDPSFPAYRQAGSGLTKEAAGFASYITACFSIAGVQGKVIAKLIIDTEEALNYKQ